MTTPLIPLEYCRIDRAARLLGCDISDILHWCSLGAIQGSIWLSSALVLPLFVKGNEVIEYSDEGEAGMESPFFKHRDSLFFPDDTIHPRPALFGCNAVLTKQIKGRYHNPLVLADGLWSLDKSQFESLLLDRETYSSEWYLPPAGLDRNDTVLILLEGGDDELPIDASQIWIIRRDLLLLKGHIESGEPVVKDAFLQAVRPSNEAPIPHPVTEHHAVNRERVLAAAIYAERNQDWQDEPHNTAEAWASKVMNHEGSLFDAPVGHSGKSPLSLRKVAELLSEAMKSGKIRKKL